MIQAAIPGFLWAGAAFALVPIGLHFLTRRPPARQPLPTARFLTEDARTELRLRNRPVDLVLLAARVAFSLLLGAAFAELTWERRPAGEVHVILLDAGVDSGRLWEGTVEEVARIADGDDVRVLVYGSAGGDGLIDPSALPNVEGGAERTSLDDGLEALRRTARQERWSAVEASWITRPMWDQWRPGFALRREALWPGRIAVYEAPGRGRMEGPVGAERGPSALDPADAPVAVVLIDEEPRVARAVIALGASVSATPYLAAEANSVEWLFTHEASNSPLTEHDAFLAGGGTLVVAPGTDETLAGEELSPRQDDRVRVIAVTDGATPLAYAAERQSGCVVTLTRPWGPVADRLGPELPDFIDQILRACRSERPALPLDQGARSVMSRSDLPATVTAVQLGGDGARLTPWILAILGMLLGTEIGLTSARWLRRTATPPMRAEGSS